VFLVHVVKTSLAKSEELELALVEIYFVFVVDNIRKRG